MKIKITDYERDLKDLNLKQIIARIKEFKKLGYEFWVEGRGNGKVNLIFEKKEVKGYGK
jgi:hypothetical protein